MKGQWKRAWVLEGAPGLFGHLDRDNCAGFVWCCSPFVSRFAAALIEGDQVCLPKISQRPSMGEGPDKQARPFSNKRENGEREQRQKRAEFKSRGPVSLARYNLGRKCTDHVQSGSGGWSLLIMLLGRCPGRSATAGTLFGKRLGISLVRGHLLLVSGFYRSPRVMGVEQDQTTAAHPSLRRCDEHGAWELHNGRHTTRTAEQTAPGPLSEPIPALLGCVSLACH